MKNKKAIAMSFNWIFAIITGVFILFLAIYGASKFIQTSEKTIYTETAASLISLFDPLETGLASGKAYEIGFKKQSRFYFTCDYLSNQPFGKQTIAFSEQTFGEEYGEKGGGVSIKNKYVFTNEIIEGKKLYVFTKPFFMPFKITDIVMVLPDSDNYCFYDSPEEIKENLEGLNLGNIYFPNESERCEGINVCFDIGRECDIKVFEEEGYVQKQGTRVFYIGDLIYGAIFSSPDIYECNIKRIKNKFNELGKIYLDKIKIIERKECGAQLGPKLASVIGDINNSRDLIMFYEKIEDIDSINRRAKSGCSLY